MSPSTSVLNRCVLAFSVVCAGCSSGSSGSPGGSATDASAADGAVDSSSTGADASLGTCDAGVSCNTIPNGASIVVTVEDPGTLPPFTGGTIVDGTYHLTQATSYGGAGAGGQRQRITFVFSAGTLQLVQDAPGCVNAPAGTATYTTSGSTLDMSFTCPRAGTQPAQYTATPTGFSYSTDTGASGIVFAFTRQ